MADKDQRDRRSQAPSTAQRVLGLAYAVVLFFIVTVVVSILIEWIGIAAGWWPADHALRLLDAEIHHLSGHFRETVAGLNAATAGARASEWVHTWLFEATGIAAAIDWLSGVAPSAMPYLRAIPAMTQVIALRVVVCLLALPVVAALIAAGLVDGLVQRDLRKFGGGHESAFLFFLTKKTIRPFLVLPVLIYIADPWSLHPTYVFLPAVLLLALSVSATAALWKRIT